MSVKVGDPVDYLSVSGTFYACRVTAVREGDVVDIDVWLGRDCWWGVSKIARDEQRLAVGTWSPRENAPWAASK